MLADAGPARRSGRLHTALRPRPGGGADPRGRRGGADHDPLRPWSGDPRAGLCGARALLSRGGGGEWLRALSQGHTRLRAPTRDARAAPPRPPRRRRPLSVAAGALARRGPAGAGPAAAVHLPPPAARTPQPPRPRTR